jgi:DNA-binding transcriptional regulator YhcF (GntR family)
LLFEIEKIVTVINGKLTFVNEDKLAQEQSNNKVKVEIDKNSISNLTDVDLQNKF